MINQGEIEKTLEIREVLGLEGLEQDVLNLINQNINGDKITVLTKTNNAEVDPVWLSDKDSYSTTAQADALYLKLTQGVTPQQITGNAPDFTDGVLVSGGPLIVKGILGVIQFQNNIDAYTLKSSQASSHSEFAFGIHTTGGYTYIKSNKAGVSGVLQPLSFLMETTEMMRLGTTGTLQLNAYTTNGFVKFSGSNGTLSVDTSSYAVESSVNGTFTTADSKTATVTKGIITSLV